MRKNMESIDLILSQILMGFLGFIAFMITIALIYMGSSLAFLGTITFDPTKFRSVSCLIFLGMGIFTTCILRYKVDSPSQILTRTIKVFNKLLILDFYIWLISLGVSLYRLDFNAILMSVCIIAVIVIMLFVIFFIRDDVKFPFGITL